MEEDYLFCGGLGCWVLGGMGFLLGRVVVEILMRFLACF